MEGREGLDQTAGAPGEGTEVFGELGGAGADEGTDASGELFGVVGGGGEFGAGATDDGESGVADDVVDEEEDEEDGREDGGDDGGEAGD